jgi:hypothetical protein
MLQSCPRILLFIYTQVLPSNKSQQHKDMTTLNEILALEQVEPNRKFE